MSEHYFSSQPRSKSDQNEITAKLLSHTFHFRTDAGVFSKKGVDFGSRVLVETAQIEPSSNVLDLGCGYGAIGIAIAKSVPGVKVVMVDVNERAVALARENARVNQVEDRVEIRISDGFAGMDGQKFDHILFNPPIRAGKSVIYRLFAEAKHALRPKGSLWIVIRKQQGAASALKELESLYAVVERVEQKKGYWILRAVND